MTLRNQFIIFFTMIVSILLFISISYLYFSKELRSTDEKTNNYYILKQSIILALNMYSISTNEIEINKYSKNISWDKKKINGKIEMTIKDKKYKCHWIWEKDRLIIINIIDNNGFIVFGTN